MLPLLAKCAILFEATKLRVSQVHQVFHERLLRADRLVPFFPRPKKKLEVATSVDAGMRPAICCEMF